MSAAAEAPRADHSLKLVDAKTFLDGVSTKLCAQFPEGTPCTIGRSRKVHAAVLVPWLAGVLVPAPACHVGISGYRLDRLHFADVKPGSDLVLCQRPACRALHQVAHRAAPRRITDIVDYGDGWIQEPLALISA